jgi:hypothetical protein
LLAEADRLSWPSNWHAAGPLYEHSEKFFQQFGDNRNAICARIGRIRAQAAVVPFDETLLLLALQLREPVVAKDAKLRRWCLDLH